MELELFALVFCITQLTPYLLGRDFTVRTDHRNLLYLSNSTIPKLVRWRVILSEFRFLVEHIEGKKNFVADGITRVHRLQFAEIPAPKRYLYEDDTIERVFRLTGESEPSGPEGDVEESDEDYEDLAPVGHIERHTLFRKYHNSMIGHFGDERTLKGTSKAGVEWRGMRQDVKSWIAECGVFQKIKHSRVADWEEEAEHHLYSCEPLKSISIDTAGPFPDEDDDFVYILAIVDNFSKYIRLYPTRNATAEEYVRCLVEWVSVFGVPKGVRTDGGPQFDSQLAEGLKEMLGFALSYSALSPSS
jgi:hypothetical protein